MPDSAERAPADGRVGGGPPAPSATLAQVADHIEHVRQVAGVDHVGIGSDFDGIDYVPVGLEDVSKFPDLFAELIRRGWSDADLKKLAGQNLLRALRQAERTAARLQREREPSTRTIEQLDGARPRDPETRRRRTSSCAARRLPTTRNANATAIPANRNHCTA